MASIKEIVAYCNREGRNKIVLSGSHIDELQYINVGREMASILAKEGVPYPSIETVYRQVFDGFYHDDTIGRYLAIENLGILFEEELHLNLHNIFDQYSKDQVLIVQASGEVQSDTFYFYDNEDFTINLHGLSHIII